MFFIVNIFKIFVMPQDIEGMEPNRSNLNGFFICFKYLCIIYKTAVC